MSLLSPLLVLLAIWLIATGRLQRMTLRDGAALGLAIVGATLGARGAVLPGGAMLGLALLYALARLRRLGRPRPRTAPAAARPAEDPAVAEARALLGLSEGADEKAIRAAYRRLIARNHPDAGGTQALAEKINEARTVLLRQAFARQAPRPSPSDSSPE